MGWTNRCGDIRNYFTDITDDEASEFANWAFGHNYRNLENGNEFFDAWNALHKDKLKLDGSGTIRDDAEDMITLWRIAKEKRNPHPPDAASKAAAGR